MNLRTFNLVQTKDGSVVGGIVHLVLSRSNLAALTDKLNGNPPDSERTLLRDLSVEDVSLTVAVTVEEDEVHYHSADRESKVQGVRGATLADRADVDWGETIVVPPRLPEDGDERMGA